MSILKWSSKKGNPFLEIDSESPDLQVVLHPFKPSNSGISVDKSVCQSCRSLIRMSVPDENLATTGQKSSSIQLGHLDGELVSLRVSAQQCPLCRIIISETDVLHARPRGKYEVITYPEYAGMFAVTMEFFPSSNALQFFHCLVQALDRPDLDESQRVLSLHHDTNPRLIKAPEGYIVSPLRLKLAQMWITECAKHRRCTRTRPTLPLPKRVLDIHCLDSIHLHVSTKPEFSLYATLSYCWGTGVPLQTTTTNLLSHREKIPFSSFPKTLQDSIQLANGLGFRYFWIDALCILQDDEKDRAEQAAQMTSIYHGCSLNIAILDSVDCDSGVLPRLDDASVVVGTSYISSAEQSGKNVQIRIARSYTQALYREYVLDSNSILSTRGWTFQETLVSVSTLFVSRNGLSWDCCSVSHAEDGSMMNEFQDKGHSRKATWSDCMAVSSSKTPGEADVLYSNPYHPRQMKTWYQWIVEFSQRSLTKSTDKLPAVAGLAARLSAVLGWTYAAGLWVQDLHVGLTWSAAVSETLVRQKAPLRAPSWSWASVDGEVKYPDWMNIGKYKQIVHSDGPEDLQILHVVVHEHFPGTFGTVCGGRIEALATLYSLDTVPGSGDGSTVKFQHGGHSLGIILDESLPKDSCLESPDSRSSTSKSCSSPYWLARVCSMSLAGRGGNSTLSFYLALKENVAAAEGNPSTFFCIGVLESGYRNSIYKEFSGGIRRKVTIL